MTVPSIPSPSHPSLPATSRRSFDHRSEGGGGGGGYASPLPHWAIMLTPTVGFILTKYARVDAFQASTMSSMVLAVLANAEWSLPPFLATLVERMTRSDSDSTRDDGIHGGQSAMSVSCMLIGAALVVALCRWLVIRSRKQPIAKPNVSLLVLHNVNSIAQVTNYVHAYPEDFGHPDSESGNAKYAAQSSYSFIEGETIYFTDSRVGVTGSISVTSQQCTAKAPSTITGQETQQQVTYKILTLSIVRGSSATITTARHYYEDMRRNNDERDQNSPTSDVFFIKTINATRVCEVKILTLKKHDVNDEANRYERYIRSFFSPERDRVWEKLARVHRDPESFTRFGQPAVGNYLLYGPQGSGKSSLAGRVCKALGRKALVSLNAMELLDSRSKLFKAIMEPGGGYHPRDVVILLEEFDTVLKFLHMCNLKQQQMTAANDAAAEEKWLVTTDADGVEKTTKKPTAATTAETRTKSKSKTRSAARSGNKQGTISKLDISANAQDVTIGDFLEVFQGPSPIDGTIIFASTNDYEYIAKHHPQLIRSGRLTPVLIDYLDWPSYTDLCDFYFHRAPTREPFPITYETSGIVDFALCAKADFRDDDDAALEHFERNMERKHSEANDIDEEDDIDEADIEFQEVDGSGGE